MLEKTLENTLNRTESE